MKIPEIQKEDDGLKEPKGESCLIEPESKIPFFTKVENEFNVESLNEVRMWKNRLTQIRDLYKGTHYYDIFNSELKRVIEFLQQDCFKDL
jgi:hypothetical protein